jgi:two-component system response regulator LytT
LIRAVIIEDEGVAARRLKSMLEKEGIEVMESLKSNNALQQFLTTGESPDLYFMDIHLSDGIIFETLQTVRVEAPIIFTTAYDEFAIKAFKQNSVDYLLKPIDKAELHEAILKFKRIYQSGQPAAISQAIHQLLSTQQQHYRDRIKVKVGDHLRVIKMEEVAIIYSESKITFLQLASGRSYPIDQSVEQITKALAPKQFYQVNRSQVVNIDYIKDVITYSSSRLKVLLSSADAPEIVVSRERVKGFKAWLG